jgi:hypothetical protein
MTRRGTDVSTLRNTGTVPGFDTGDRVEFV